jgi:hypothetical protein
MKARSLCAFRGPALSPYVPIAASIRIISSWVKGCKYGKLRGAKRAFVVRAVERLVKLYRVGRFLGFFACQTLFEVNQDVSPIQRSSL